MYFLGYDLSFATWWTRLAAYQILFQTNGLDSFLTSNHSGMSEDAAVVLDLITLSFRESYFNRCCCRLCRARAARPNICSNVLIVLFVDRHISMSSSKKVAKRKSPTPTPKMSAGNAVLPSSGYLV
jgi:hypothetical protein